MSTDRAWRSWVLAGVAGGLGLSLATGAYPLTIDDNHSCGGVTARVAIWGPHDSGNGEPTDEDRRVAHVNAGRCQAKARWLLLGSTGLGAASGMAAAAGRSRLRRRTA